MVQPGPIVISPDDAAAYAGPYDANRNGSCGCHGAPVNGYGRCQPLNLAATATAVEEVPR